MQDRHHLNGWKEIGSYLGRTVRTAQRWEAQLEMPVHRPATKKRTAVIAYPHQLDSWLVRNCSRLDSCEDYEGIDSPADIATLNEKLLRLQREADQLAREIKRARGETPHLVSTRSTDQASFRQRPD
jgi:hypothetical protein